MRWRMLALAVMMVGATSLRADYLFMHFTMAFKKPQQGQSGPPVPVPGGGTPTTGQNEDDIIKVAVHAVVEASSVQTGTDMVGRIKAIVKHKWGSTHVFNDEQLITRLAVKSGTIKTKYNNKREALGKNRTNEGIYDLAEWCLNYGLVDEFVTVMDEVAKTGKKTGMDKLDRAVEMFTKVKAELAQPIEREDLANYWRGRLGFRVTPSEHYALLYNTQLSDPPEVAHRLKLLEENMKAVYYYFALKGIALKMPEEKLVAVLLDQPEQFKVQRALIEDEPLVADGFFAARDNVVVFSNQRLDNESILFKRQMQAYYQQGWDRKSLLEGKGLNRVAGKSIDERYRMETLALLDAALDEEGERATVTHDGTRQLFVAAGLQKPAVIMPDYLQFGVASVFETPKGPYPTIVPLEVRSPYWHGWAGPSWEYARIYKLIEQGALDETGIAPIRTGIEITAATLLLRRVVMDADFNQARDLGQRAGAMRLIQARTHAWALCYYLTKMRTAGLIKLYDELAKMPRDLELEPNELLGCFCRAFDLADTTGLRPDPVKFEKFAQDWVGFMKSIIPPGQEYGLGVANAAGSGNPGSPGSPKGGGSPKSGPPKGGGG